MMPNFVVAITGASGAIYAVRLLDVLRHAGCAIQLSISPAGQAVIRQELGLEVDLNDFRVDWLLPTRAALGSEERFATLRRYVAPCDWLGDERARGEVVYHHHQNLMSSIASGSSRTDGMVICPCSGGTLSAIAQAASGNLIHRAADVHLKERRKLILAPRETPLSLPMLDNMRRAVEAGAVVLPAMPGFYHGVSTLKDVVDFVVARICDQLGVEHSLMRRWGEDESGSRKAERGR